ncbi:protein giant isoform X2 [Lutzomyia longipalpis]|uniref:protein giant isoform X2 n=1 Tax=Lutzomyia longipalpis TaxID=7200 RepID=UPI0024834DD5|nr:protein giant isoform X2 [Lutzomyia longipalpis]
MSRSRMEDKTSQAEKNVYGSFEKTRESLDSSPQSVVLDLSCRRNSVETGQHTPSPPTESIMSTEDASPSPHGPQMVPDCRRQIIDDFFMAVKRKRSPSIEHNQLYRSPKVRLFNDSMGHDDEESFHSSQPSDVIAQCDQPSPGGYIIAKSAFHSGGPKSRHSSPGSPYEAETLSFPPSLCPMDAAAAVTPRDRKAVRPFKAYPRDPLTIASAVSTTDAYLDTQSTAKYAEFRQRMLQQMHEAYGGQRTLSNPKMRRYSVKKSPDGGLRSPEAMGGGGGVKDEAYMERRMKNNAAAKKSRDRRRIKEDEIAIRAAFLERENIELKFELASTRKQLAMYEMSQNPCELPH